MALGLFDYMETQVTKILNAIAAGESKAASELLPIVYSELRNLATSRLNNESAGHTLQPTALVHEAYIRLVGVPESDDWKNRAHFFAAAAEAMRRILIEHARAKKTQKRGGDLQRVSMQAIEGFVVDRADDLLALDAALCELANIDDVKAELVKLRFFVGLNMEQTATAMGMSLRTAERTWAYSRAWLQRKISQSSSETR